ncbi:MAG TPA: GatB/YqeY domain-containing protein [Actinospica sp.]|nr:GatB/YqeY domain-containing protein [Actinospica sp.]
MTTPTLKAQLRSDLTTAMKARDELRSATLRMALSSITTEEVAGKVARELSDDEVLKVLTREVKKRKEAAEAFAGAGRAEQAAREEAEGQVLTAYLPAQLTDDELQELVVAAVSETGAEGPKAMGAVMKVLTPRVAGRADGSRVAAAVKAELS